MTTTTQPTMHRTAVHARPSLPRPVPVGEPAAAPSAARLVAWMKLHWLTILFCGGLLGAALAALAWTLLPSKFESYALLRVASAPFSVSNNRDPNRTRTEFATYLKTNAGLIKNEFVLNKALGHEVDGVRISDLPTIKEQKNPFQYLEDELLVSTQDGSEIIRLTLKGHNPDDVRRIVNAVQSAFMDEVIEKEIKERQAFLLVLETTLVNLQKTLHEKGGKPIDVQVQPADAKAPNPLPAGLVNAAGPPDWVKKQIAAARVSRSLALQEQVTDLPLLIASQKSRLEYLKKRIESPGTGAPAPSGLTQEMIAEAVERDADVRLLASEEQRLRREYNLDRARYANAAASTITAKLTRADEAAAELAELKKSKAKLFAQVKPNTPVHGPSAIDPLVTEYDAGVLRLQELEAQLAGAKQKLAAALEEISKLPVDADPLKPADFRKPDDKKPIDPNESLAEAEDGIFRGLAQNAAALRLDLSSPKRVSVLQTASSPMQKDTRKQILATVFAGLLGFGIVGLVVFGYEASVKKACGLADVKAAVPAPIVSVIPWENEGSLDDPIRRTTIGEAVDKLRTYVTQTWLPRGATTVAVTSAITDEGKAFTAFGLADSLADAGYRTLVVDFDLRAPAIHTLAKLDNAAGVCELLRGEADFARTIKVQSNGLHVLPAGKWSDTVRRVAGGGRLEQLLRCLKEPYDCVIVHGHPLLNAAESIEVARRCEVVLLCAKYRETCLPLLARAADRAATMEVPYTGVVYLGATPKEALC